MPPGMEYIQVHWLNQVHGMDHTVIPESSFSMNVQPATFDLAIISFS